MGVEISFIVGLLIALVAIPFFDLPEFVRVYGPISAIRRVRNWMVLRYRLARKRKPRSVSQTRRNDRRGDQMSLLELPKDTAIVTYYFNPAGLPSVERNYRRFMHEVRWWGRECFSAELVVPGQEFPSANAFIQRRAEANNILWQRERLLNLIVEKLPSSYDKIAIIDPTILMLNNSALKQAEALLENSYLAQLCREVHYLDEKGAVIATRRADLSDGTKKGDVAPPEERVMRCMSWMARRDVFPLYDRSVYGFGQSLSVSAWLGTRHLPITLSPHERVHYEAWAREASAKVLGRIGSLEGACMSFPSAGVSDTPSLRREEAGLTYDYDPSRHVAIDEQGLLAWQEGVAPNLRADATAYLLGQT